MRTFAELMAETRRHMAQAGSLSDICTCGKTVTLVDGKDDSWGEGRESVILGDKRYYEGGLEYLPDSCAQCFGGCLVRGLLEAYGGKIG